ncbi:SGNH/GDSL hydrolase family protein [Limnohabitans sp.]|uniref:SGNH/GDSL hydrolase family protein n=1 Tax=Limnohabitans sp. TaxID=1907725 RepID=UPI002FDD1866
MNPIFSRTLQAICSIAIVGLLSACGASSTVEPFKPTRVVGLGDGFNDPAATVDDGTTTRTVVGQVAAYFGQPNIVSKAKAGAKIKASTGSLIPDLAAQIDDVVTNNGGFSATDLVFIAVGTFDVKEGTNPNTAAQDLVTQVQRIKAAGAKHILIMPVLDVTRTPWGRVNTSTVSTTATNTFNEAVLLALSTAFGGQTPNSVIYANASGVTSLFLTATSLTVFSPFTDTGFSLTVAAGTLPACGSATLFTGCTTAVANANYPTMMFANGIHLTPAGNRWVAQFLFNATAQGWR